MTAKVYSKPFAMVPEWILDADISDRAVRLFARLNRYANAEGRAFPSRKTIAERLRCSVNSVDRAVTELVDLGAIVVEPHPKADGSLGPNSYYLWPAVPTDGEGYPQGWGDVPPSAGGGGPTGAAPYRKESQENEIQGTKTPGARAQLELITEEPPAPAGPDVDAVLAEFWSVYPRVRGGSVSKKETRKKIELSLREGHEPGQIVDGARSYAREMAEVGRPLEKIATPQVWVGQARWEAEPIETREEYRRRRALELVDRPRRVVS